MFSAADLRRNQVTLVVNYDAPSNTEDYVHRIGRTAGGAQMGWEAWEKWWSNHSPGLAVENQEQAGSWHGWRLLPFGKLT